MRANWKKRLMMARRSRGERRLAVLNLGGAGQGYRYWGAARIYTRDWRARLTAERTVLGRRGVPVAIVVTELDWAWIECNAVGGSTAKDGGHPATLILTTRTPEGIAILVWTLDGGGYHGMMCAMGVARFIQPLPRASHPPRSFQREFAAHPGERVADPMFRLPSLQSGAVSLNGGRHWSKRTRCDFDIVDLRTSRTAHAGKSRLASARPNLPLGLGLPQSRASAAHRPKRTLPRSGETSSQIPMQHTRTARAPNRRGSRLAEAAHQQSERGRGGRGPCGLGISRLLILRLQVQTPFYWSAEVRK
jgi:hypothetical protein